MDIKNPSVALQKKILIAWVVWTRCTSAISRMFGRRNSHSLTPKNIQGLHSSLSISKLSDLNSTLTLLLARWSTQNPDGGRSSLIVSRPICEAEWKRRLVENGNPFQAVLAKRSKRASCSACCFPNRGMERANSALFVTWLLLGCIVGVR